MNYKHGGAANHQIQRLYRIWRLMKNRCTNKNTPAYKDYGARLIVICDEWMDYLVFKEWALSNGYQDNLTIDRIDVNGNYEPSNCRWITKGEQSSNTRRNTYYTINGETHILAEWSRIYHIQPSTILRRIGLGWNPEKAITTPLLRHPRKIII